MVQSMLSLSRGVGYLKSYRILRIKSRCVTMPHISPFRQPPIVPLK